MIVLVIILFLVIGAGIGTILKLTVFKNDDDKDCTVTVSMFIWPFILIFGGTYYIFIFIKRIVSNFIIHLYFKSKKIYKCDTCKHCKNYNCDKMLSTRERRNKPCEDYQLNKFWIFKIDLDK